MAEPKKAATHFIAPHPGSQAMPRWDTGELIDAPRFTWRNWAAMIGPGMVMGASAIGGGEWLTGPLVTARYGGALLWLATLSILAQVMYNIEISRYTLYTGEPIFTGKFRTLPGPLFWVGVYILLDIGTIFPYLAASAATPLAAILLGHVPDPKSVHVLFSLLGYEVTEKRLLELLSYTVFLVAMTPMLFGGKVYNSIKVIMSCKLVTVIGFLLVLSLFFSNASTWIEIFSGFGKFGNVPISRGEDRNGNGTLDPGEDWDGDGHLDIDEHLPPTIDSNRDRKPDTWPDRNGDGKPDKFIDVDGDGIADGDNIDNVFVSLWEGRGFPTINFSMVALLCAMVAISGNGGLSNTPISNFTREQGWGMGHHVGAIPSVVGGHQFKLSHVGMVFQVTPESLPRWRRWYRHLCRDQLCMWMPACFLGLALPSMLSVQFLRRGTEADTWTAAGMTAGNVGQKVGEAWGSGMGNLFWYLTLLCGFLVLAPSMASTADGFIRRWVDVFWTALPVLRKLDPHKIRNVYFVVLCTYAAFGLYVLAFVPQGELLTIAGMIYNYALGFSCFHTLTVNLKLLPPELRPGWFVQTAMVMAGTFFLLIAGLTTYTTLIKWGWL